MAKPTPESPTQEFEGTIERIVFCNPETQYTVARAQADTAGVSVVVVGKLGELNPGESIRASGQWCQHPTYGRQFEVASFQLVLPHTVQGIEKYLGSGLIEGIGPIYAKRLVREFGEETLEIIDQRSAKLLEVEGIGPKRLDRIREAWARQRSIREVMMFLQEHNVGTSHAAKIFAKYGQNAITLVRSDPYRLAEEIRGIGFLSADRIAQSLGFKPSDPARIRAGLGYTLHQASTEGHIYLPSEQLVESACDLLGLPAEPVEEALETTVAEGYLIRDQVPETAIYSKPLFLCEAHFARRIAMLARVEPPPLVTNTAAAVHWAQQRAGITYAPEQAQAVMTALDSPLTIITGGPGVGKTTIVRALVDILGIKRHTILLMAPTGRAAKRLSESAQLPAQTLHRGLGFQPHTRQFSRDAEHPLEADMVIVDEVSMLDQVLAYHLIKAIAHGTRLVLVGDPDQLPSVGPGNVLSDLIRSEICPVITLNQVFRQSGGSRILHSAHAIRKGEIPDLKNHPKADFFFMSREDPNEIANTIVELAVDRLPRHFHLDPFADIQVLSPMHRGPCGVEHLNELIEERLLGRDTPGILRYGRLWRRRAKVMQTRNNYDQEVFNGDIGFVSDVNTIDQNVSVTMDGREVVYPFQDLDELVPAYAISVHKSQGSEYPAVIVPVSMQHRLMLRRNLIYTAVTRAKRILILVGAPKALRMAVETVDHEHTRCTGLRFRLQADLATGGTTIAPESELLQEEY